MELLVIGLGSNLGDREANLDSARHRLNGIWTSPRFSSIYQTLPWGMTQQPLFLNQIGLGYTSLSPMQILDNLKQFEVEMGREPGPQYGPRLIDLDILYYGQWVVFSNRLTVPHPRLVERAFTLIPLAECLPNFKHPLKNLTNREMLAALDPPEESCKLYKSNNEPV